MTPICRWPSVMLPGPLVWRWWVSTPVLGERRSSPSTWPMSLTMRRRENISRWGCEIIPSSYSLDWDSFIKCTLIMIIMFHLQSFFILYTCFTKKSHHDEWFHPEWYLHNVTANFIFLSFLLQGLKRLMTICQKHFTTDPSKCVEYNALWFFCLGQGCQLHCMAIQNGFWHDCSGIVTKNVWSSVPIAFKHSVECKSRRKFQQDSGVWDLLYRVGAVMEKWNLEVH